MAKELRLGAFVILALGCFAVAVFLIGSRAALFHASYRVNTQFDNVAGLEEGAAVRVGGVRKGEVKHIVLPRKPGGKVDVQMDLESITHGVVKRDSVAAIRSEGLLGDKYIEISFGSPQAPDLSSGESIASQPPIQFANLFAKADGLLDTANGALGNIKDLSANLDTITLKINSGRGTAGALVNDRAVYQNAAAATAALADDAEALKHNFLLRGFFRHRGFEDSRDLTKFQVARLPGEPPAKTFEYDSKKLFGDVTKSDLKNGKDLNEAGAFLQSSPFGGVVIAASTGMRGDSQKDKLLTEAQSLVVRDYLVNHFSFDDTRVKTIGLGKSEEGDANRVRIFVYPRGTELAKR